MHKSYIGFKINYPDINYIKGTILLSVIVLAIFNFGIVSVNYAQNSHLSEPLVVIEEDICTYIPPNNGADPLWCWGAPIMVRQGAQLFISIPETGENIPPLCNTRWQLYMRDQNGWRIQQHAENYREREPCPLMGFPNGRLFLSVNTSLTPAGTYYKECKPHLLEFSALNPLAPDKTLLPEWKKNTDFTDHSYRGCAVDASNEEMLLLNINAKSGAYYWSYLDSKGARSNKGSFTFPIRSCYPQVALKEKTAHVLAIGDITEPNEEWKKTKFEKLQRNWDFVFRKLFYVWTPDITDTEFSAPVEIDNVDETAGHITNLDLWLDKNGGVHIIYLKKSIQYDFMRDKFFPGKPITCSLEYCYLKGGTIIKRRTLIFSDEDAASGMPGFGRFHATENGDLYIVYYFSREDSEGKKIEENRIAKIIPENGIFRPITINLKEPFTRFFTASERGGSAPSKIIDLYGIGKRDNVLKYAQINL